MKRREGGREGGDKRKKGVRAACVWVFILFLGAARAKLEAKAKQNQQTSTANSQQNDSTPRHIFFGSALPSFPPPHTHT